MSAPYAEALTLGLAAIGKREAAAELTSQPSERWESVASCIWRKRGDGEWELHVRPLTRAELDWIEGEWAAGRLLKREGV